MYRECNLCRLFDCAEGIRSFGGSDRQAAMVAGYVHRLAALCDNWPEVLHGHASRLASSIEVSSRSIRTVCGNSGDDHYPRCSPPRRRNNSTDGSPDNH